MAAKGKKKAVDPIKQREKRAKIVAIAGFFVLVGVAAIEVPTIMSATHSHMPPPTAQPAPSPTAATDLPNVAGTAITADDSATTAAPGGLADSDPAPPAQAGQLVSFSVFASKNPFTPQPGISSSTTTGTSTASAGSSNDTTTDAAGGSTAAAKVASQLPAFPSSPLSAPPTSVVPSSTAPSSTTPSSTATPATPGTTTTQSTTTKTTAPAGPTATISVNGVTSKVAANDAFPKGDPVFRVVSVGDGTAQIGIVGGSLASGSEALTLSEGKPVTLADTNDGKQFRLVLVRTS